MAWKGRYLLGDRMPLSVWCRDSSGTPTLPTAAPLAMVYSDSAKVLTTKVPLVDRYGTTAFFQLPLLLDGRFDTGAYRVVYQYIIGSTAYGADEDNFEVVAGGHADGAGLSMYFYDRPTSSYILQQTDGGRVLRRRNPRVT